MKIMSDGPVDLCYSNAKGDGLSADTITAIGQTAGQVGSALAQRQRQLTEVEQKCGKRPIVPGKRRKAWESCAAEYARSAGATPIVATAPEITASAAQPRRRVPTWAWVVGGVAVAGIIGFVIYRSTKK